MLDALMDGSIALCDAGIGIGKTYAYLAAGAAFHRFQINQGKSFRPTLISTSSIALQNAIQMEYLPILSDALTPDACAVIIDEAHKLPDAARQMFGTTMDARDIHGLIRSLRQEKFVLAAESLAELSAPLLRLMEQPFDSERSFQSFSRLLVAPARNLHIVSKQLQGLHSKITRQQLRKLSSTMELFTKENDGLVFYAMEDRWGGTMLCAVATGMTAQLRSTLWNQERPAILTSGTLAVGRDFHRFKKKTGLLTDGRVTESVSASPFDYKTNCLLYLPLHPPQRAGSGYFDELTAEIAALLDASWGHALALFTSYAAMSAIKERLAEMDLPWEVFTMGCNAVHTTQQFKNAQAALCWPLYPACRSPPAWRMWWSSSTAPRTRNISKKAPAVPMGARNENSD